MPDPLTMRAGMGSAPRWPDMLRALREAAGVTQVGWAARLGLGRSTVQRWERGIAAPDARAEALLIALCDHEGLFRTISAGPLAGLTLSQSLLQDVLADARLGTSGCEPAPAPDGSASRVPGWHTLPSPLTSFLGREQEVAEVIALLDRSRLLTLTGPGGTGKTRLAIAVARQLADRYPDGVWFVDLSAVAERDSVMPAIAEALGVREGEGDSTAAALAAFLRRKQSVLVLDSFEHVLPAARAVHRLLCEAPGLKVLASSRVLLRVDGENAYPVLPLPVADLGDQVNGADPAANPAVRLFVERAQSVRPDFALSAANAAIVGAICRRLDGLPLAIELAAARTRLLPLHTLLVRLEQRLPLLSNGAHTLPERQKTLRRTIQWSWDLLAPAERTLLCRLSVFTGGWTLEAAETVCNPDGTLDVIEGLMALSDSSLVRLKAGDGEPRYDMLGTLREFALEQLDAQGETVLMRRRHSAHMRSLAEQVEPLLRSGARGICDRRIAAEWNNIREALRWMLEDREIESGLAVLGALQLWLYRHAVSEGRRLCERFLAQPALPVYTGSRAKALRSAAMLAYAQGDFKTAIRWAGESVARLRRLGDRAEQAWAEAWLVDYIAEGTGLDSRSERSRGRVAALGETAVAYYRAIGDRWHLAAMLVTLGRLTFRGGDHRRTRSLLEESVALFHALGDDWFEGCALRSLGDHVLHDGDYAAARRLLERALHLARLGGTARGVSEALEKLAGVCRQEGEYAEALRLLGECLRLRLELGAEIGVLACMEAIAESAEALGQPFIAVRLYEAVRRFGEASASNRSGTSPTACQEKLAALRTALGEPVFDAAWAVGVGLSWEQAAALALATARSDPADL